MNRPPRSRGRRALRYALRAAAVLSLLALAGGDASAQYFGRNKVQWEKFDWRVLKTEHFDVHYYPAEEQAVRDAARMAERWYTRLSGIFGYQLSERKPLILYADPSDFQQTTVIGGLIGEGTGGVTEPVRTRVIMPLAGTYEDTDHVLGHELVHVFQFETLLGRREDTPRQRQTQVNLPLWFIEGLAEYLSLGRENPLTAMWLRDAVLRDDLPDLRKLSRSSRYFPYRWGQAFWAYVGGRWGDQATTQLFVTASEAGLEPAMQEVLGLKEEEFSNQWRAAIRAAYQPVLDRRQPPKLVGGRILPRGEGSRLETYVSPSVSPDGSQVIFLSTRSLFSFDLYLADAATGEVRGKLVSAETDPHFDALSFLESAGSWSPDARKFVFVVYSKGDNELAVLDVGSRRVERRIGIPGVGALWNPSWSPDGRSIVVSGSAGGVTDLYLVDAESGRTRKLTDDVYSDLQPSWSPDGRTIAFASDRGPGTDVSQLAFGRMGLWLLDVASGQVRPVPVPASGREPGERFNPQFGPGGSDLYFLEARGGINDIFRLSLATGELFQVTDVATGVAGITRTSPALSVAQGNGRVVFSLFNNTEYALHSLDRAQAQGRPVAGTTELRAGSLPPAEPRVPSDVAAYLSQPEPVPAGGNFPSQDYRSALRLDYLAPTAGVGVSSFGYAVGGDVTAVWSDMLNERQFGFTLVGSSGGSLNELGAQAIYLNQAQRWNWGIQGGHVPFISAFTSVAPVEVDTGDGGTVIGREIQQLRQTVTLDQVGFVTQYPFSATRRFEATAGVTRLGYDNQLFSVVVGDQVIDRSDRDLPAPPALSLYQGSVALVGDSSYFGYTSPVRGQRYRLELEPTFGDLQFQSLRLDYRRYFFARPVTFAFRGLHLGRFGRDAEDEQLAPLFLGEETLVRGYAIGSISGSECTPVPGNPTACPEFDRLIGSRIGVANFEVRFPLTGAEGYGLIKAPAVPIELAAFVDAGTAWTKDSSPDLRFQERSIDRVPVVSAGVSARLLLGGFAVLHFYYAKPFQRPEEGAVTGFFIAPGW